MLCTRVVLVVKALTTNPLTSYSGICSGTIALNHIKCSVEEGVERHSAVFVDLPIVCAHRHVKAEQPVEKILELADITFSRVERLQDLASSFNKKTMH